jgi:hypothetical protein
MVRTPAPSDAFQADILQFEEAKASQSEGESFRLSLYMNVKASLMVM